MNSDILVVFARTFAACALGILLMSVAAVGQQVAEKRNTGKVTIHMNQRPLYTVLWTLIQKYDVAVGFEESELDREHGSYQFEVSRAAEERTVRDYSDRDVDPPVPPRKEYLITVDFTDADVETVLNSIVRQMRNYTLEKNDGIFNIVPVRGRDDRLRRLMDLPIKQFLVGIGASGDTIQPRILLFLPEFKLFLSENDLVPELGDNVPASDEKRFPDGLRFDDLTFRELLNRLTMIKRGGWIVRIARTPDKTGKELIEVDI